MAKKTASKKGATKTAAAEPTMTPREAAEGWSSRKGPWQKYCRAQKDGPLGRTLGLNETGLGINTDDREAGVKSIDAINSAFNDLSARWEATPAYGRQHYNGDGFCHNDGLKRVDDESLAILAVQALEELAQRTSLKGTGATGRKMDPVRADKLIKTVVSWAGGRPAAIKASKKAQAYKAVQEDIDGKKVMTIQSVE